jgi:RNA polymerase sigma-70 factor (ECF subfamily)
MPTEPTSHWVLDALARYERPLVRYAAAIVGSASATDVVQDTFLRLCKQDRQTVEPHLRAWLFTVCRNRALDMRRDKRHVEPVAEVDEVMENQSEGPAEALLRKEAMRRVLGALDTLPEKQREVVLLKFSGELSYQEIAEVLGTSASNVGFLLHTALKSLRAHVAKDERGAKRGTR